MAERRINYLSLCAVRVKTFFDQQELSVATGSIWEAEGEHYLVTNWHVVTGRHAETTKPLHAQAALPNRLEATIHGSKDVGHWKLASFDLYEENERPEWLEHPTHGHRVDIAALQFDVEPDDEVKFYCANNPAESSDFRLTAGQDVFILGFPRGLTANEYFPVWKRGTFASEPDLDLEHLPRMLVDSATREGLSGAPVFAQFVGLNRAGTEKVTPTDWFGSARRLAGVYSS